MAQSFKEQSKLNWSPRETDGNKNGTADHEQLQIGCLQRIADATEKMASSYTALEYDRDWHKKRSEEKSQEIDRLNRVINALRGWANRRKNPKPKQVNQD